ncbi:MAG: hypothetical protein SFV54_25410 [Bryobacteraceae bacterium]|nr:hypothetical protein [Bryobacteraceae bacterium]
MRPAVLLLVAYLGFGQTHVTMPPWLSAYPGSRPEVRSSQSLVDVSYTAEAPVEQVLAYLSEIFQREGVGFRPNADGVGTSIRASAPECDLLLKVREVPGGTSVRISCSARVAGVPAEGTAVVDVRSPSRRPLRRGTYTESEHTRRMRAEAEAAHQGRIDEMKRYDRPVAASAITQKPFYNDDAPPLVWPSWLVQVGSTQPPKPMAGESYGKRHLEHRYRTTLPMTDVYRFYEALLKTNGLRVANSQIGTGQTLGRIVQNASGYVEGHRSEDGTVGGPSTRVEATFRRHHLNEPITVTLRVTVSGSFGRR